MRLFFRWGKTWRERTRCVECTELSKEMDPEANRRYKLNKKFLEIVGQWPFQESFNATLVTLVVNILLLSFILVQVLKICTTNSQIDYVIEIIPPLLTASTATIKYQTCRFERKKMRKMLKIIESDWQTHVIHEELEILKEYAEDGKKFTIAYAVIVYVVTITFLLGGVLPQFLDIVAPLNESRPRRQTFLTEYFVDEEKYFYTIFCHTYLAAMAGIAALVAADGLFIIFTQHACGIFRVAGYRLENLLYEELPEITPGRNAWKKKIELCVHSHRSAIRFANLIESTYSMPLLIQFIFNIICMSVTLLQVVILMGKSKDVVRYIFFVVGQLFHMFCNSYPGQRIMDHSSQVFNKAYSGPWYEAPLSIQKMLVLVIRRSMFPTFLTAGKIFTLCLESFMSVVQTSMSYFTVLSSMR